MFPYDFQGLLAPGFVKEVFVRRDVTLNQSCAAFLRVKKEVFEETSLRQLCV